MTTNNNLPFESCTSGRVAVVTGGSRGIGLAVVTELLLAGYFVATGGRHAPSPELEKLAANYPEHLMVGPLDVCRSASVNAFTESVCDRWKSPDILINSAGISIHSTISSHTEDDWLSVIDTNLSGVYRCVRSMLPMMMESGWGRIVNIGSTAARVAMPTHAAYCASKAGLIGLTKAVALEGAANGVNCVAVSPTWVETEMLHASVKSMAEQSGRSQEAILTEIRSENPKSTLVQPKEVASLIVYLCSELCPSLTMEDIQVNSAALW